MEALEILKEKGTRVFFNTGKMYFPLYSFSESAKVFWLTFSKNIERESDTWHGNFQPKLLEFGKVINNRKLRLIMGSVGQP